MSQESKQVDWCLKKAEKEIEEARKKGQRNPKHRGLVKCNPDKEAAIEYVKKAEENLNFAISLDSSQHGDIAISSLFYSMYHCFLAIAAKFGYESRNQACTISLIAYLKQENKIDIDNQFIEMFKYQEQYPKGYGVFMVLEHLENYVCFLAN